jgi:PKD repeat protein
MKKIITLTMALLAIFTLGLNGQNAWINEIHYDNVSGDVDEMIEVVIENPGSYTLSLFQVDLYNGSGGAVYNTKTLDQFTVGNTVGSFTFYYYIYPVNGIQNGAPDGMALSYSGTLIPGQFLSYEGTFTGVGGPADGVLSTDIGVEETSSTPVGYSLQLTGSGSQYSDFNWVDPAPETRGALNNGQGIGGPMPEPTNYPTAFAASPNGNMIDLSWTDATGAQLPGAYIIFISEQDDIVAPVDGTPVPDDLDLSDGAGAKNVLYGNEAYTFTNLSANTLYYFAIYPYTNSGANIDYKTDGTAPEATATTNTVVLYEDFNWSWMAWERVSVTGPQEWSRNNTYGIGGSPCAYMNGYSGGAVENEDWLISPPMNLDMYTGEVLTFYTAKNFSGPDLEVKYSTNYDGSGNPASGTWTDITGITFSPGGYAWTASGNIDFSGISGTSVYLAFVYNSTSSSAATWEVDNVMVTGSGPDPEDIVINEIMYNAAGGNEDWIEIYNNTSADVDLSGWHVRNSDPAGTPIAIPAGTMLGAGNYYTISIATDGSFPFMPDLDGTLQANWELDDDSDVVHLYNLGRIHADHVPYLDVAPWPTAPDGNGPSLALIDPDYDNALGSSWDASLQNGGSPGSENFPPVPTILVTSPAGGELWEQGSEHEITWNTIVYSGNIKIELIDTNTWFPQLIVSNIASSLNSYSWTIMGSQATGSDYIIRISDLAGGPVGESPNTFSIIEPYVDPEIVITEIMYNPPESGNDSLEFIELYNNGGNAVDLGGFEFAAGVVYTFPSVVLNPGEYFVVAVDSMAMLNTFGINAYQWTSGALSNSGELIHIVDGLGFLVDSVRYDDVAPWPTLPDGFGPSLTFCNPDLDNGIPDHWTASTEFAVINGAGDTIWATPMAGCDIIFPTADFTADDTTIEVGGTADFTDLSTGGTIIAWNWTFEGGTPGTSTEQNPTGILYDTQGSYDVTLEVENDYGQTAITTKTDFISVDFAPVANFEADATMPAIGQGVNFTDLSTGTITEWLWEFEGGTPANSILQNPEPIVYAAVGFYDVRLTVSNDYGSDSMLKEDYIDVQPIGIGEFSDEGAVHFYPNPANGNLNIENKSGMPVHLNIYAMTGQLMKEDILPEGSTRLSLEGFESGIYFIRYYNDSRTISTSKLVIR